MSGNARKSFFRSFQMNPGMVPCVWVRDRTVTDSALERTGLTVMVRSAVRTTTGSDRDLEVELVFLERKVWTYTKCTVYNIMETSISLNVC